MNRLFSDLLSRGSGGSIEPLEQRIAPAALPITRVVTAVLNTPLELQAGDVLSTAQAGGSYFMFVEKGSAVVFTTDLNNNGRLDFNEVTGIAAGDGLRLISFVDIHGDIVTNLRPDGRLTDSDNNATNGLDGRVLLNNKIEKIELRSITQEDLGSTAPVLDRLAFSTYSIWGNIYAGRGFGAEDGGLIIDVAGNPLQTLKFSGVTGITQFVANVPPTINSIKVGSAASGGLFSFGTSLAGFGLLNAPNSPFHREDIQGALEDFQQPAGQDGADIIGVRIADGATKYNLGTLQAGDGGFNGRGGNIKNVAVTGDFAGGYSLIAGDAGVGNVGQAGGSIINYNDFGSITSQVILQSGNGGRGLQGSGGNGGSIELETATVNIAGRLIVVLGDGGDGLGRGGDGGSQKKGSITTPESAIPFGLSTISSFHQRGDIFNTISTDPSGQALPADNPKYHAIRSFDFDLDGSNDVVYSSAQPNQLVVLFGANGNGFDPQGNRYPGALGSIYLNGLPNTEAITVGDFNGDGRPDIATASQDASTAGIAVFLSRYQPDPVTGAATFVGFHDPIYSAIAHFANYQDTVLGGYFQKAIRITDLVTGDFDNDGVMDLGMVTIQTNVPGKQDESPVVIMRGDSRLVADGQGGVTARGSGYFFTDFISASGPLSLPFDDSYVPLAYNGTVVLKASALRDGGPDFLFAAAPDAGDDARRINLYDFSSRGLVRSSIGVGQVDTNRDPAPDRVNSEDVRVRDFTIADIDDDGFADLVVLAGSPENFVVTLKGTGTPNGFGITSGAGSQGGIALRADAPGGLGLGVLENAVGILTTAQNDGRGNDVAIVNYHGRSGHIPGFIELSFPIPAAGFTAVIDGVSTRSTGSLDETVLAFDTYRPLEANTGRVGYALTQAVKDNGDFDRVEVTAGAAVFGQVFVSLANNGLFLTAGDGGNSQTGQGGKGGQIGNKLVAANGVVSGTFNVGLPDLEEYEATVRMIAGDGGNGNTGGGRGGSIRGMTVTNDASVLTSSVLLFAGDGGSSVRGRGGNGGSLDALSIETGQLFLAGNGGRGVIGGNGGSVIGNKIDGLPDTLTSNARDIFISAEGGDGGLGLKRGGTGGNVKNFTPELLPTLGGEANSLVQYLGGAGGNSLSGAGGKGGSILNSSPVGQNNNLNADINLRAGQGGNGRKGGAGGDVENFINTATESAPLSITVMAGNGGLGTVGKGGKGGNLREINVTGSGLGFEYIQTATDPEKIEFFPYSRISFTPDILFGRYIAGAGGDSNAAKGGAGGTIKDVVGIATSTSFAVAAGRGGDGLRTGARGGNVIDAEINAAAAGKVLVIAGEGGDTFAAKSNADDPLGFGGVNGKAGKGGSIVDFRQTGSQSTIVDLIAGNGGSTVNHGTSLDLTTKAGKGGSISDVNIRGNIGNVDANVPIVAYNDISAGERVADFVANTLVGSPSSQLAGLGNVGIVVGATGRVKDNNGDGELDPASTGVNGSLRNVVAANIMSAVAGSVDRIASIQNLQNVRVRVEGAIFGADKAVPPPASLNTVDYLDQNGAYTNDLRLGGSLLDGAIVARNERLLKGLRDFIRR